MQSRKDARLNQRKLVYWKSFLRVLTALREATDFDLAFAG
jgi:hypothetical protein